VALKQYSLGLGDGAYGPGDIDGLIVQDEGVIPGPTDPNWQPKSLLLVRCLEPTSYRGQELTYLAVAPRYAGVSLKDVRLKETVVGVFRMLPGIFTSKPKTFAPDQVVYWAVGVIRPLPPGAANPTET